LLRRQNNLGVKIFYFRQKTEVFEVKKKKSVLSEFQIQIQKI